MKAFIGQYFDSPEEAFKVYGKLSPEVRKLKSVVEYGGKVFIMGNTQIEALFLGTKEWIKTLRKAEAKRGKEVK